MRRKDREITDPAKMEDVVRRCVCCRIGFCDQWEVYIVPLNFGYEKKDGVYTFYFHGAREGRKINLMQASPRVGFEMDTGYALSPADTACGYGARFLSIIGNGTASIVEDPEEKIHGLSLLMEHNTGKKDWTFEPEMVDAVTVFKLTVSDMSCKEHL